MTITVNVARSADEAERLARGENITVRREGGAEEDEAEAAKAAAEAFFEPGAARTRPRQEGDEARPKAAEPKPRPEPGPSRSVEDVELLGTGLGDGA